MFDLDEPEDQMSHLRCTKSLDMALAILAFQAKLHTITDTSENGFTINGDDVWKSWEEAMSEYGIQIESLVR
jgi:hypothetical protein